MALFRPQIMWANVKLLAAEDKNVKSLQRLKIGFIMTTAQHKIAHKRFTMKNYICVGALIFACVTSHKVFGEVAQAGPDLAAAAEATSNAAAVGGIDLPSKPPFSVKDIIERTQKYLNSFKTLHARFKQEDPDGTIRSGEVYLQKPGKMNLTYKTPTQLKVVADGTWLSYDDPDLDQVSYVPLSSTPAAFILQETVDFKSVIVEKVEFAHNHEIQITLHDKDNPEMGSLLLFFKDGYDGKSMELTGWQIVDQSTQTTTVTLKDLKLHIKPPKDSFELSNPHQN